MKNGKRQSDPDNGVPLPRKRTLARTLTLTATLAALGTSLGVDVEALFAAEPKSEEGKIAPGGGATQIKIGEPEGATQWKWKAAPTGSVLDSAKKKSPAAVQDNTKGAPRAVQDKTNARQGNFKTAVPPSDTMKQNVVQSDAMKQNPVQSNTMKQDAAPSPQMKFDGLPPGAAGTKEPGTGR